ncbi:TIGR02281 family clan AA aspartic protease [Brevundimonas sp. Root1279]|uniref:TIGR02281 family clan AA aspartic protease n=1 Tax=Brevundimonas sp. Root1279 TaxID=1736443 RepID=UPI0006F24FDB|nr:TIGR02281 family clan AA aspartic protease [Brevundimonas sp. Root1279]KQW82447.1 hypothetical protein ASC65_09385 [Brevundimonas sp. Root1279]
MRFDLSSAGVLALAVASSLSVLWWMDRAGLRGEAHAAESHAVVAERILRGPDGHYWAEAVIDGRPVRLMVDTGASLVTLTPADAARLGLELQPADFTTELATASGPVRAARVELPRVAVAGARVDRVEAIVVADGLPHSLLGMSYLARLSGFEATRGELRLRQ